MDAQTSHDGSVRTHRGSRAVALQRIALVSATALAAINIWTGAPLLALWVGSQVARGGGLSMGAVFVVVLVLAVLCFVLMVAVGWLSNRYDELTGRPAGARRTSPWLRSMRGEREELARARQGINAIERSLVITVVLAVLALEVWFFFLSGSPLPAP